MKLTEQRTGRWNEDDRLELAKLLIKAGYRVAIIKEKKENSTRFITYVEALGDEELK